jgi:DnaK suppressor protein
MEIDKKFLAEQKMLLETRREKLMKELNADGVKNVHADNEYDAKFPNFGDKEDENAAEVAVFEGNLSMEKNLELSLFNVDKALKKLVDGNYGLCEKCGKNINPERLQAFPSATACMDCKKKIT